jgi:hypothetical protein
VAQLDDGVEDVVVEHRYQMVANSPLARARAAGIIIKDDR